MATVKLMRVDNRMIHGQVTAFWIRTLNCGLAVIIDDVIPTDKFLKKILVMAMPPSTKLKVYTCQEAVEHWNENQFGAGNVMVIFKDIIGVKKAMDAGFPVSQIQIGGTTHTSGQKQVLGQIYLSPEEAALLNEIESRGVEITFQVLAEHNPTPWANIRKRSFPELC